MTDVITCPIVVAEGVDVSILSSVEEAEEYLEGMVASGGSCVAFDAEGRALNLEIARVQDDPRAQVGRNARIGLAEATPTHAEELCRLLRDYLQACGERVGPEATLRDLIRRCRSIHLCRE